jgi:glyoxylase-like metal-dependent hydrolase (beta-lactamase superfamily II)
LKVGSLEVEVIDSPGHCGGHLSYLLHRPGGSDLFTGDALFWGGEILLQDIWDCSPGESCRSVERLADRRPNGLYPAHGAFARDRGWVHLDTAMNLVRQLLPPRQFAQ